MGLHLAMPVQAWSFQPQHPQALPGRAVPTQAQYMTHPTVRITPKLRAAAMFRETMNAWLSAASTCQLQQQIE
jgi:hypothetical protein